MTKAKDGRSKTSPQNGSQGGRPPAPPFAQAAIDYIAACEYDDVSERPTLLHWRNAWYRYNGHGWGYWPDEDIAKGLLTFMTDHTEYGPWATPNYVHSVTEHMKTFTLCGLRGDKNAPLWVSSGDSARNWMSFENQKALDVWEYARRGSRAQKLSPDLFTTDHVDYEFKPKETCPKFMKYLKECLPSKASRDAVQEMLGLLLADTCKYETFFYLYGPTARNGKTVLLNIVQAMVGKHNVCHVGLDRIADRFESWPLAEAKVNIHGDMATDTGKSSLAHVEGLFKDLISGANLEYQKKGKDKFSAPCRARFVFAGNSLPTFVDRSDAIWERLRVIHFPIQIAASKRDPNLADKIISKECSGIFNWAMKGLKRVIAQNKVTDCKEGIVLKQNHRLNCDHESKFLSEMGYHKGKAADFTTRAHIYESYKSWMDQNGYMPKGAAKFYARVLAAVPGVIEGKRRITGVKESARCFVGLTNKD